MGQCWGKPSVATQQSNHIGRNLAQRVQAWQSTGTVALRDAHLQDLPAELAVFSEPSCIRRLDCTNNSIKALPSWLLQFSMLQKLTVSHNALTTLPHSISQLQNLRVLQVDNNKLLQLPASLGQCTKLEHLSAGNNGIKSLPATFSSLVKLRILNMSHNQLTVLPPALGECTSLEELDISNNGVEELPAKLGALGRLQLLSADANCIKSVPTAILRGCSSLATLTLHSNPITIEMLQATDGWDELEDRRTAKFSKLIAGGALMSSKGMDEGIDR